MMNGAPGTRLVRLIARIVPRWSRDQWVAEWDGELHHAWHHRSSRSSETLLRARLLLRCLGALPDALLLRQQHGGSDVLDLDLKYALRTLIRRPAFATVVILTLALGIGATTSIFSVVRGVLLRPLPYPEPDRLVMLLGEATDGNQEKVGSWSSFPDYSDIRAEAKSFAGLAARRPVNYTLTGGTAEPSRMTATLVTSNYHSVLGITPALGRFFSDAEQKPDAPPVVMLGHAFWMSRFGGDAGVLGKSLTLDGEIATIIGVMPPSSPLVGSAQIWRPIVPDRIDGFRGAHRYQVLGRLADGVTRERAESEVREIAARLEKQYPQDNAKRGARLQPMHEAVVGNTRRALLVLLGAVGLVLLIGCTNLASLFLVRATARQREISVRIALGADRGRLLRHWMTESLLLTVAGGAAGLVVAWLGMRALLAIAPTTIPRAAEVTLDMPVLLFLFGISVLTGLAFGLLPALPFLRGHPTLDSLKDGARGATTGSARHRLRKTLVLAEMALATVLVVGAALLIESSLRLQRTDPGFNPDRVLVAQIVLPPTQYTGATQVAAFYAQLRDRLARMPGVESSAIAFENPLSPGWTSSFTFEGRDPPPPGQEPEARVRPVLPGYFRTAGIRLLGGRDIAETDRADAPGVVVINDAFARRHFKGQDPIGKRIVRGSWWPGLPTTFTIVGVVSDEKFLGLAGGADPATYFPHTQFPMNDMWLLLRAKGDPRSLIPEVRRQVWALDANLPVENVSTMPELLSTSLAAPRFNALLMSLFAAAAMLIAAIGIYGVMSYMVAQRTGEIGVRMALGASRAQVLKLVVGQGVGLALVGIALGVVGALGLARVLTSLLYGVNPHDPVIFSGVAALLATVAILAAFLPAHRASRIEPVTALRYE
jgi:putative ABC transport system permease protein